MLRRISDGKWVIPFNNKYSVKYKENPNIYVPLDVTDMVYEDEKIIFGGDFVHVGPDLIRIFRISNVEFVLVFPDRFCIMGTKSFVSVPLEIGDDFDAFYDDDFIEHYIINNRIIYSYKFGNLLKLGEMKPGRTVLRIFGEFIVYLLNGKTYSKKRFGTKSKLLKQSEVQTVGEYTVVTFASPNSVFIVHSGILIGVSHIEPRENLDGITISHNSRYIVITADGNTQTVCGRSKKNSSIYETGCITFEGDQLVVVIESDS